VEAALEKFLLKPYVSGSYENEEQVVALGITVAPLLMKHLDSGGLSGKSRCLAAFNRIDYEPAIPAIAACARDKGDSHCILGGSHKAWNMTVGEFATFILLRKSKQSELARRSMENVLLLQRKEFLEVLLARYPNDDELSRLID